LILLSIVLRIGFSSNLNLDLVPSGREYCYPGASSSPTKGLGAADVESFD
jgi:hypothetical protein